MLERALLNVRSTLFYAGYLPVSVFLSLMYIGLFPVLPAQASFRIASSWAGFVLHWLRLTCGVRWEVQGEENIPDGVVVVLANHQSSWETLYLWRRFHPVSPILKQELLSIPIWGTALRLTRPIALDRSKPREAGKSLLTQGVKRLAEGYSIVIFPEGTRSGPGELLRFSKGGAKLAALAGVPIVPIALQTGHCWPARQYRKHPGLIRIEIGRAIPTKGRDAVSLTAEVEAWIGSRVVNPTQ